MTSLRENLTKEQSRFRRKIAERDELLKRFDYERRLMARLAADTPQFYSPLAVCEAKIIRDYILALLKDETI